MKKIIKITVLIIIIIFMIYLVIMRHPISIKANNVIKIDISIGVPEGKGIIRYYDNSVTEKEEILALMDKLNSISARNVSEKNNRGKYADVHIILGIYSENPNEFLEVRITGDGYISLREGGEGDRYKMSEKNGNRLYLELKELCK